jgi:agmatine deiminase
MPKADSANRRAMQDNLARLKTARDVMGRPFEIIELPEPAPQERHDGRRLEMSYVNFYFTNYGLVMPAFDDPADAEAAAIMMKVFPDRRIVQVPALDIVQGGGGIHCITQQQPSGTIVTPERTGRR